MNIWAFVNFFLMKEGLVSLAHANSLIAVAPHRSISLYRIFLAGWNNLKFLIDLFIVMIKYSITIIKHKHSNIVVNKRTMTQTLITPWILLIMSKLLFLINKSICNVDTFPTKNSHNIITIYSLEKKRRPNHNLSECDTNHIYESIVFI